MNIVIKNVGDIGPNIASLRFSAALRITSPAGIYAHSGIGRH